ncbi:MAG: potassium transporter Kup [Pseudomonadota bacterium]|nr:potassium transporter Kup [Xanthomonadaceae bacterium]MDE3209596.1 potassium transporter Kup [Pseudomonadota bacterium]
MSKIQIDSEGAAETRQRLFRLTLGAVGVVYGDIGTSPLYTMQTVLAEPGIRPEAVNVLGGLSLMFWALIIVVTVKYMLFILRADNKGEGGIMALMALAQRSVRGVPRLPALIAVLAIFGAALMYGDGVITPSLSVLSAVEGLEVAAPALKEWVVPITMLVILGLFWLQRHGTAKIGAVFGPICVLWFLSIAALGLYAIVQHPQVLVAVNPVYAVRFFAHNHAVGFFALGAVVLTVTGTEALYADMGHFGKRAIRTAWLGFVLPALLLNYFGQGALVLSDPKAAANPFYLLVPQPLLYPMIALATMATVIASQAVISGAFSMTREAIQLGYLPRMPVVHTSHEMAGQIFMPWVNRALLLLILGAVLGFRHSSNLAAAYGIAVTGTMVITTLLALIVARYHWKWNLLQVFAVGALFLTVDVAFCSANLIKVEHGGWFPLALGLIIFVMMSTWRRGRELVVREIKHGGLALLPFIQNVTEHPPLRVPGTAIFLTADINAVPHALLHNLKHNKVLHERNVLLTVAILETPVAEPDERIKLTRLTPASEDFYVLELHFGFAENPNIPRALAQCPAAGLLFDMMDTTFFLSRETVVANARRPGMALWRDKLFAFMQRNALPATAFFQIPGNRLIELGAQVEI